LTPSADVDGTSLPSKVQHSYEKEKKEIEQAFRRRVALFAAVAVIAIIFAAIGFLMAGIWTALTGLVTGVVLLGALPPAIGEYPFFSIRIAMRFGRWVTLQYLLLLQMTAMIVIMLLGVVYPVTLAQGAYFVAQAVTILSPSTVSQRDFCRNPVSPLELTVVWITMKSSKCCYST